MWTKQLINNPGTLITEYYSDCKMQEALTGYAVGVTKESPVFVVVAKDTGALVITYEFSDATADNVADVRNLEIDESGNIYYQYIN